MGYLSFFEKLLVPNYVKPKQILTAVLEFDPDKCLGCNVCAKICPARAISPGKRKGDPPWVIEIFPGIPMCMACGDCQAACRQGAINMKKGYQTTRLFKRIAQAPELNLPKKY
jgi:formate hydrogenlyase subunit 6/NADH:ubiquinone oxidoreductase subunit I